MRQYLVIATEAQKAPPFALVALVSLLKPTFH